MTWTAASLRDWFAAHEDELSDLRPDDSDGLGQRIARGSRLMATMYAHGITTQGWPVECGGSGGTAIDRAVVYDEITRSGFDLPESVAALEVVGSALAEFAPQLAANVLPQMLAGKTIWCQGFSEPDAGSDLAALRTSATLRDGEWVLDGQKVWTSLAHHAAWCMVLARTGSAQSRHRGLTMYWVDLTTPGVVVRPLVTATGEQEFSEVFFDQVLVAPDRIVGEIGGGWAVAMHMLQYERGMWAWQRQAVLHAMLERRVLRRGLSSAEHAELGRTYALLSALRGRSRETVERLARGEILGPEVSVDKLLLSQAEKAVHDLCRRVAGPFFAMGDLPDHEQLRRDWFYSRASSLYGGTQEIQKNILARRILRLPQAGHT